MRRARRSCAGLAVLVALAGCDGGASEDSGLPVELGECPDDSVLWEDVAPLFAESCAGCHSSELEGADRQGAAELVNYDTPEAAYQNDFLTWSTIWSGQMPPAGPLDDADALLIWEWLSCGGPQ